MENSKSDFLAKNLSEIVVLCGGRGSRLRPLTDTLPKVLVPINGRPIVDYIVDFYRSRGIRHFTFCVGYKAGKIINHYRHKHIEGARMAFSDSGESASMLKRIWAVKDAAQSRLFVCYGDTLIKLDMEKMVRAHLRNKALATIVIAKIRNPFGLVTFDSRGWVDSFVEKPMLNYYIGNFIIERKAFELVTPGMLRQPDGKGLVKFFLSLASRKKLAMFQHGGPQITFNTEQERQAAEKKLGVFYTYSEGR